MKISDILEAINKEKLAYIMYIRYEMPESSVICQKQIHGHKDSAEFVKKLEKEVDILKVKSLAFYYPGQVSVYIDKDETGVEYVSAVLNMMDMDGNSHFFKPGKTIKCCICGDDIHITDTYWGNDAFPVMNGYCCDKCNNEIVIKERIKRIEKK